MIKKKKFGINFFIVIVVLAVLISGCGHSEISLRKLYEKTADVLLENGAPTVGSANGEWVVIGLSRSDRLTEDAANDYLRDAESYVRSIGSDRLHDVKSTENSRLILGITAAGGDPTNMGGYDLTAGLSDMEYVKAQGCNGPIWGLIALDSGQYEIPIAENEENQTTREKLVDYILSAQSDDGGWGLNYVSDVDMTAMALQALAPYKEQNEVNDAILKALNYLSENQLDNGGFESYGTVNSESCAQVIVSLTSLNIDPLTDVRFIKNDITVLDALCSFSVDGGFCHLLKIPVADIMATEQAYYAMTAYFRFKNGETSLYDMSDIK